LLQVFLANQERNPQTVSRCLSSGYHGHRGDCNCCSVSSECTECRPKSSLNQELNTLLRAQMLLPASNAFIFISSNNVTPPQQGRHNTSGTFLMAFLVCTLKKALGTFYQVVSASEV
jgi:hypothetical protein